RRAACGVRSAAHRRSAVHLTAYSKAVAERFVRTIRSECLDWLLILNRRHLERVCRVFINHYNGHRPHRALDLTPPSPTRVQLQRATDLRGACVQRRDLLGGLLHEYNVA